MERNEPNLVPEWYKGTTSSATGNSNLNHLCGSSHSDERNGVLSSRNRLLVSVCDFDSPRPLSSSDKPSLSFRISSSSNGYMGRVKDNSSHAYSSFGRSHHERDWDRNANQDKDLDLRERDRALYLVDEFSNYPSIMNKSEKDSSRLTQSTISGRFDTWVRRNGHDSGNGAVFEGINGISKSSFERDFPSLGNEERHVGVDVVWVSSPGLDSASHSFPVTGSATMGGDAWTSALAELPSIVGGTGPVVSSGVQTNPSPSTVPNTSTGLNMAETLSQTPIHMQTGAQAPNDSLKIEELHRHQVLKLRPVIPSILKNSALNSADKTKTKGVRASDFSAPKTGQLSSHPAINNTSRPALRADVSKTLQPGNLQVLSREKNVFSPTGKNIPKGTPSPKLEVDGKSAYFAPSSYPEKKPSQTQNRNEFFNSLRRKSYANQPTNVNDSHPINDASSSNLGLAEQFGVHSPSSMKEEDVSLSNITEDCEAQETEKLVPDEEEVAFLRSLGWEENAGEEALTREEIETFLLEYKKLKPALKLKI